MTLLDWSEVQARAYAALSLGFDPDQPRDDHGRWTDAGGGDYASPSPQQFITARDKSKDSGMLSPLKPEDLSRHTLITTKDMKVGVAVDANGDLQNLFNNGGPKGAAAPMVAQAITRGAITLDCYDNGFLPGYYRQFGFKETGRMKFDPAFAHNWDSEKYGQPDVVFMAWNDYPSGGEKGAIERATGPRESWIKNERSSNYASDYDAAKAESRTVAKRTGVRRLVGEVQRSQAERTGNQSLAGTGESHRRAIIDGRGATFYYLDENLKPAGRESAKFLKAVYLDGGIFVAIREGRAWRAFDPNEPRDEHGRWTSGGESGEHPGEGYSASARVIDGVIHTSSVYDAQRALFENRKVELSQPDQVSILLKRLGETTQKMIAQGEKAPVFNLCNVTVKGTSLFCADSKGIPRVKMPQMDDAQTKAFRQYLKDRGYKVEKQKQFASHLRATQNELNGAKVAKIAERLRNDPDHQAKRLVVSKDNYILDGHHHWGAKIGLDAEDGNLENDTKVKIARVNIGITKLLEEAERFTGGKGHVSVEASFVKFNPNHEPAGSPTGGQFTSGDGEGSGGEGLVGHAIDELEDKYGLNDKDQEKLNSWMGSGYRELRTDPNFKGTLEKLPSYSGRVYRGTRVTPDELRQLKVGSIYRIKKFTSSSIRRENAKEFADPQRFGSADAIPLVMEINDSGRRIPRDMAAFAGADESEVVLMPGDNYKVEAIEPVDDGDNSYYRIRMTHV